MWIGETVGVPILASRVEAAALDLEQRDTD